MVCIRERLNAAMVCNGNCLHSPLFRSFNDVFYITYNIHITHFGMAVKLHSLY